MQNITFLDFSDDHTGVLETAMIYISSVNLSTEGLINVTNITVTNCSISFLHLSSVSGHTEVLKYILFDYISITDATFSSYNDLITFGPMYTEEDVEMHMNHFTFDNLNFEKLANIIHLKQQTLNAFILENSVFENMIGGRILVEPLTVSTDSLLSQLHMENVTVTNNDFKDSTFIVLKEHVDLVITG
jgi:hypothetical protein